MVEGREEMGAGEGGGVATAPSRGSGPQDHSNAVSPCAAGAEWAEAGPRTWRTSTGTPTRTMSPA